MVTQLELPADTELEILVIFFSSIRAGFRLFLGHVSQRAFRGAKVDPLGGRSPERTEFMTWEIKSGGGGHPGR